MLTPVDEFNDLKELLKFAIRQEIKAYRKYMQLSDSINENKAKELLNTIANEELQHEKQLKDLLEELGI